MKEDLSVSKRGSLPLVSIIVPAHNAEDTLDRCLVSIERQTYCDLEIIVVVNACLDETEEIARSHSAQDGRVRVAVTDMPGVSHARNLGLGVISGSYVGFVDADDWIEPTMYERMVVAAEGASADVVCCGKVVDSGAKRPFSIPVSTDAMEVSADDFYRGVLVGSYGGFVWNKLFSRAAIAHRRFDETMAILEDAAFCCALTLPWMHFFVIPGCYYHYVINDASATNDLSCLVTNDGKWAYLEGALTIQSRAATETQVEISETVNCTFAASGIRELAGKASYKALYEDLRKYMRPRFKSYLRVEENKSLVAKTAAALYFPYLWVLLRKCVGFTRNSREQ